MSVGFFSLSVTVLCHVCGFFCLSITVLVSCLWFFFSLSVTKLASCLWLFYWYLVVFSTYKTELLLKVALNTPNPLSEYPRTRPDIFE